METPEQRRYQLKIDPRKPGVRSYLDRTFCSAPCHNQQCKYQLSIHGVKEAERWALPIEYADLFCDHFMTKEMGRARGYDC